MMDGPSPATPGASAAQPGRLLIVDDDPAQLKALCEVLNLEGFASTGFGSAKRALETLVAQEFDLLITDLMMPEMDGISLLEKAREISADTVTIVMTGHAAIDTAVRAMQAGALDYIVKPFKLKAILPVINRALAVRRLRMENQRLAASVSARTRELENANRELEALNRELNAFSYSVSHDLRAPLRTVQGFCQMYLEDYGSTIPAEGRRLLDHVVTGATRMGQIIEDLLRLAQLGRQELRRRPVPLNAMIDRLIAELRARAPERNVEVVIGELGECDGDASLLEQVFVNLLSNAFKFTSKRELARIEVGRRHQDDERVYFVRDNGAGFDPRYLDKLFGIFQRLHSAQEFAGTGVGLSIVQRIVQRHGGRIWAEAAPDQGATFYFTIPPA